METVKEPLGELKQKEMTYDEIIKKVKEEKPDYNNPENKRLEELFYKTVRVNPIVHDIFESIIMKLDDETKKKIETKEQLEQIFEIMTKEDKEQTVKEVKMDIPVPNSAEGRRRYEVIKRLKIKLLRRQYGI
jgi:hypothetical protein